MQAATPPLPCTDDNIVVIRAASRTDPPDSEGQLQLDFSKGVIIQRNIASTGMERLRKVQGKRPASAAPQFCAVLRACPPIPCLPPRRVNTARKCFV